MEKRECVVVTKRKGMTMRKIALASLALVCGVAQAATPKTPSFDMGTLLKTAVILVGVQNLKEVEVPAFKQKLSSRVDEMSAILKKVSAAKGAKASVDLLLSLLDSTLGLAQDVESFKDYAETNIIYPGMDIVKAPDAKKILQDTDAKFTSVVASAKKGRDDLQSKLADIADIDRIKAESEKLKAENEQLKMELEQYKSHEKIAPMPVAPAHAG